MFGKLCPRPSSAPTQLKMNRKPSRLRPLGNTSFLLDREKVEGLCSECTSPLFSGTYVSIRDTDIRLAIKKIKQDTNSAHSCLQPELPILFQSRKGGVDYVGLKVWPRSFLHRPTSLRWVEVSLTGTHQNSTLPPCPTSPPS